MNNNKKESPFIVAIGINSISLLMLTIGFLFGFFLDLGSFRESWLQFVVAILFLITTIVVYSIFLLLKKRKGETNGC